MEKLVRIIDKKNVILLKEEDKKELLKIINGLLNTNGGVILVGINPENKEVEGVNDLNSTINHILSIITLEIEPLPKELVDLSILSENNKTIIKIKVARGVYKLYSIKKYGYMVKGCYYYKDEKLKGMSMNLISSRLEEKDNTYRRILEILKENPSFSSQKVGDTLNMSMRNTQRYFKELKDDGMIERKGSNKTGTWVVNDDLEDFK